MNLFVENVKDYGKYYAQLVSRVCLSCEGVGGNLVAVQASRLSTALHRVSTPYKLPENFVHGCPSPLSTFFASSTSS